MSLTAHDIKRRAQNVGEIAVTDEMVRHVQDALRRCHTHTLKVRLNRRQLRLNLHAALVALDVLDERLEAPTRPSQDATVVWPDDLSDDRYHHPNYPA